MKYDIYENTHVNSLDNWISRSLTWEEFTKAMSKPKIQEYSMDYYNRLKTLASLKIKDATDEKNEASIRAAKKEIALLKDVGCFIPGKFKGSVRRDKYFLYRSMIALDIDDCTTEIWKDIDRIEYKCMWHTTHSHTPENPRIRVFFPLTKVINTKEEYRMIVQEFCKRLNLNVDQASFKANQVMFYPATPKDSEFKYGVKEGNIVNPYDFKLSEEDIKRLKRKETVQCIKDLGVRDNIDLWGIIKTVKSPYDMGDAIGKFCRRYNVVETIDNYLEEVYEKGTQEGCYTYIEGSSINGLKVYPDKSGNENVLAYSFHSTDPLNDGHCHNAFDLLKVHRFKGDVKQTIKFIKDELGIKDKYAFRTNVDHEADYYYYTNDGKRELNVEMLIDHILNSPDHKCFNTPNGFYIYNDNCYELWSKNNICKLIADHLVYQDVTATFVTNLYTQLCWHEERMEKLNGFNNLVLFNNMVLKFDWETGEYETLEHSPDILSTYRFKHSFTPGVKCLLWEKFLNDVLPKDQQTLLQEIMGYMMIPDNSAKKFFSLYGVGDSGKSVILKTVIRILDSENVSSTTLQQLGNPNLRFATSGLYGKLGNIVGDLPAVPIKDTGVIKMLTGDDLIQAERKGKDEFRFFNKARLLCSMNAIPPSYNDKSKEFYNRMIIVPFLNAIPEENRIKFLERKFSIEGVINWAIEGLQRLLRNNLTFSVTEVNRKLVADYEMDNNNVHQFVDEAIIMEQEGKDVKATDLYKCYKGFCQENGYSPLGKNKFMKEAKNLNLTYSENCKDKDNNRIRGFKNVILKKSAREDYLKAVY